MNLMKHMEHSEIMPEINRDNLIYLEKSPKEGDDLAEEQMNEWLRQFLSDVDKINAFFEVKLESLIKDFISF